MTFSQDELLAKEEAKIQRTREAHEQRRLRILNAKVRIIGLDVDALDAQVAEKRQNASNKNENDRLESEFDIVSAYTFEMTSFKTQQKLKLWKLSEFSQHQLKRNVK
jgi:hypothetical protein